MFTTKLSLRMTAFLLFAVLFCVCTGSFSCQVPGVLAKTADAPPSGTVRFFAEHQPPLDLSESDIKPQILRLCSSEMRELSGRKNNSQIILLKGQEVFVTGYNHSPVDCPVRITAPWMGCISVLAVPLGSNSPPVYCA